MGKRGDGIRERRVIVDGKEVTHYQWRLKKNDPYGVTHELVDTCETREAAVLARASAVRRIATGEEGEKIDKIEFLQSKRFKHLIEQYQECPAFKAKPSYKNDCIMLKALIKRAPKLADRTLLEMIKHGTQFLAEYRDNRISNGRSWSIVRREFSPIRTAFKLARRGELWIDEKVGPLPGLDPFKDLTLAPEERKHLIHILKFPAEDNRLYAAVFDHFKSEHLQIRWLSLILLALTTALRSHHLCKLQWKDIDFDNLVIFIPRSYCNKKKNAPPIIPMSTYLAAQLKALETLEFHPHDKNKALSSRLFPIKDRYLNTVWTDVAKSAKLFERTEDGELDYMHFNDLRHTASTRYSRRQPGLEHLSPEENEYLMGHKDVSTNANYNKANIQIDEWVDSIRPKMDAFFSFRDAANLKFLPIIEIKVRPKEATH